MAAQEPPPPATTIMPFDSLPACARQCGILYDANGGCVPPAVGSIDNNCFCGFGGLSPWHQGPSNICPDANCAQADLASVQSWFTSYCSSATGGGNNAGDNNGLQTSTTTSSDGSSPTGSRSSSDNQGPGGDWISNHWRWVIGIVVLVVAIAGIWIGACIWRRRYLKRKERAHHFDKHSSQSAFPAPGGSTVHVGAPGTGAPPHGGSSGEVSGPGMFMPSSQSAFDEEKPKRKKWTVRDRT